MVIMRWWRYGIIDGVIQFDKEAGQNGLRWNDNDHMIGKCRLTQNSDPWLANTSISSSPRSIILAANRVFIVLGIFISMHNHLWRIIVHQIKNKTNPHCRIPIRNDYRAEEDREIREKISNYHISNKRRIVNQNLSYQPRRPAASRD